MEAAARKPGNVHPLASFVDLRYDDFAQAAAVIGEPLAKSASEGVGRSILNAISATQQRAGSNVNLGIVLLLAPLAAVPDNVPLPAGIQHVLQSTTNADAQFVYEGIRLANPGGMATVSDQDVSQIPTVTLREAMAIAADRDQIANQYVTNFAFVIQGSLRLKDELPRYGWELAVIRLQLWIMSLKVDSLIARKCGMETARIAQERAERLLAEWNESGMINAESLQEFDVWLRSDGHRRNPGTTADLICAMLFAALRDQLIVPSTIDEIEAHVRRLQQSLRVGQQFI